MSFAAMKRFLLTAAMVPALALLFVHSATAQEVAKPAAAPVYLDEPPPAPEPTVAKEGPVTEKYDDGKVRVERQVRQLSDNQIVNHGKFTEYYRNGKKFAEGSYENGVHQGAWSFWHENGQLAKTVNFNKGLPDGAWEVFRADGTLMGKKSYKNGKRDGTWISYFKDGKTVNLEQTYVDNKLEGPVKINYESGKPRIASVFKNGLRHGPATEWEESGRKLVEANYVDGKLDGELTRYDADGKATKEFYKDNKPVKSGAAAPAAG
jgi:antitoxin component YwqK of YwqJK toxin-antitoxin module